jgi:hypothetical protein
MKIPRDVSGKDLANTLCRRWQYKKVHQVDSHIILETSEPVMVETSDPNYYVRGCSSPSIVGISDSPYRGSAQGYNA